MIIIIKLLILIIKTKTFYSNSSLLLFSEMNKSTESSERLCYILMIFLVIQVIFYPRRRYLHFSQELNLLPILVLLHEKRLTKTTRFSRTELCFVL